MNIDRVKFSVLVWIAVYPVVTLLVLLTAYAMAGSPLAVRTLVTTVIMVPTMTFLIIPYIMRGFGDWLATPAANAAQNAATRRELQAWIDDMAACPS